MSAADAEAGYIVAAAGIAPLQIGDAGADAEAGYMVAAGKAAVNTYLQIGDAGAGVQKQTPLFVEETGFGSHYYPGEASRVPLASFIQATGNTEKVSPLEDDE